MRRRIEIVAMISFVVLSSLVLLAGPAEEVEAVGQPEITIALAQAKQTAYVAPGQDGIVTFTGTVFCQAPYMPNFQYITVQLSADAGGWPVSVPPALTFSKAVKQQSFTLSVQVPIGTNASTEGQLSVSGRWSYSPGVLGGTIPPATALIFIKQYYALDLSTTDLFTEGLRGEVAEVEIEVENTGNGDDEIALEVANRQELVDRGIETYFSDNSVNVPPHSSDTVILFLRVEEGTSRGTRDVMIEAYSKTASSLGELRELEEMTIFFEVVNQLSEPEPEPEPEPEEEEPEPEPEEEEDPEEEPEEEPEPEQEEDEETDTDMPLDEDLGDSDIVDNEDQEDNSSASIVVPIAIILVLILTAGICVGLYLFIRSSGKPKI